MKELTIIVPFRCETTETDYLYVRLAELVGLLSKQTKGLPINTMIVDSGSAKSYQDKVRNICQLHNAEYYYFDNAGKTFSIGECRDVGVRNAKSKAVTFMDVDLRVDDDFWGRLLNLMKDWGVGEYKKSFFSIPCIYLSQEGTKKYQEGGLRASTLYIQYAQGLKQYIEAFAQCSSMAIINRDHYMAIGGHDKEFRGHGYEDFELYNRLLGEENIIPLSRNYLLDKKTWDTSTYEGFRSRFTLIARPALISNLMVLHLWHPRPKSASFYDQKLIVHNRILWQSKFDNYLKNRYLPEPLVAREAKYKTVLYFGKQGDNATNCIRNAQPYLGEFIYDSEYNYFDDGNFLERDFEYFIKSRNISLVVFPNPYGNEKRLEIFNFVKANGIEYCVFERGALTDSWFFDFSGFNANSESYDRKLWNRELEVSEIEKIDEYINQALSGKELLEAQKGRIGADGVAQQLKIGNKKILFVPLQRPSDTVIKYFCGAITSYENFLSTIDDIAKRLKSKGWLTICKKHPLETTHPKMENVIWAPDDINFIDLIEASSAVALINSGVGVYSMMASKPCFIFGEAFYAFDGINQSITSEDLNAIDSIVEKICEGYSVDMVAVRRFIYYLVNEFYSFGVPIVCSRKEKDGALRTITTGIDFYQLRIRGEKIFEYENKKRSGISLVAPLFERFALDIVNAKKLSTANKTIKPVPVAKPAVVASSSPIKVQKENANASSSQKQTAKKRDYNRLINKFKRDPYLYCSDSKNSLIRAMRVFFKKR